MAGTGFCFRRAGIEHIFSEALIKIYMLLWKFDYLYDGIFIEGFVLVCEIEMQLSNFITSVMWLNFVCNSMTKIIAWKD